LYTARSSFIATGPFWATRQFTVDGIPYGDGDPFPKPGAPAVSGRDLQNMHNVGMIEVGDPPARPVPEAKADEPEAKKAAPPPAPQAKAPAQARTGR
jgi:hypothetical protein